MNDLGFKSLKLIAAGLLIFVFGCSQTGETNIAVSYISGEPANSNYANWLKHHNPEVKLFVMNKLPADSVEIVMNLVSGLLLTGGEDVYPGHYGQAEDTVKCGPINHPRDSLEFRLIDLAMQHEIPILGICRGQQILNVAMGGSLIVDIPTEIDTRIYHRCYDWENCSHEVVILRHNLLGEITGLKNGNVNSNHHQAVKILADDFKVLAIANDGIMESIGWNDPKGKPWLLGVQWHPERMEETNPLSSAIANEFLKQTTLCKN
jgi:putative glutamine amidotransferase